MKKQSKKNQPKKKPLKTEWLSKLAFIALEVLRDNDGQMALGDLLDEVEKRGHVPEAQKKRYQDGGLAWRNRVQFRCDHFVKAGFLKKGGGIWYLTADGEESISKGEVAVTKKAKDDYDEFLRRRKQKQAISASTRDSNDSDSVIPTNIEGYQSMAMKEIQKHIREMGAYEFQELCAALLRGMGYYVRHVTQGGPDGGVDILAYTDPLGGKPPRIKVQVKRTADTKTGEPALRELVGLLTEGDIGVFISSAGFAKGCRNFARNTNKHLELFDLTHFITLWRKYYDNLSEKDKSRLPLQPIYFLDETRAMNE